MKKTFHILTVGLLTALFFAALINRPVHAEESISDVTQAKPESGDARQDTVAPKKFTLAATRGKAKLEKSSNTATENQVKSEESSNTSADYNDPDARYVDCFYLEFADDPFCKKLK